MLSTKIRTLTSGDGKLDHFDQTSYQEQLEKLDQETTFRQVSDRLRDLQTAKTGKIKPLHSEAGLQRALCAKSDLEYSNPRDCNPGFSHHSP